MSSPRVSVIVPLYNGAPFIDETIGSVLGQTFGDLELIIVDDGSHDGGDAIAWDWERRHPDIIRVLTHPDRANRGAAASRNVGIAAAHGPLIAFIDADDVWPPNKLAEQVATFDRYPELGAVAGAALYWSSWEGGEDKMVVAGHRTDAVLPAVETLLRIYPLGRAQAPCPSAIMVRREPLVAIGGFEAAFTGPLQLYEDQAFLTKLYLGYPMYFDSRCQLKYRQHAASCVARTTSDGKYGVVRGHYLFWLARYLLQRRVLTPAVWRSLTWEIFRTAQPRAARMMQLTLYRTRGILKLRR